VILPLCGKGFIGRLRYQAEAEPSEARGLYQSGDLALTKDDKAVPPCRLSALISEPHRMLGGH
jgi:hypothetical protein